MPENSTINLVLTYIIPALILSIGGGIIGSIPGIMNARNQKQNSIVDNANSVTNTAMELVEPLREDIRLLRISNEELSKSNTVLSKSNKELILESGILTERIENIEKELCLATQEIKGLVIKLDIWVHGASKLYKQIIDSGQIPSWNIPNGNE